jgi:hypothetical protein
LPGHARIATPEYLERRGVHLLLNHPWITSIRRPQEQVLTPEEIERWPTYAVSWTEHPFPSGARLLEIPIESGLYLLAVQLRPQPGVDSAVAAGRWRAFDPR